MAKFGIYPSYLFKDHDPVLDKVDTLLGDSKKTFKQVHEVSGVSMTTLHSWRKRKTKRPQFATIAAVVRGLGGEINITYRNKKMKIGK